MSGTSPPATSIADDNITGAGSSGTSVSRLLSSYGVLVIANLACQALGFIGLAVVARRVGPHDLGAYGFASNLSGYFALPLMAGMAVVGIRELATADDSRGRIVAEVQSLQVLNGVVAYVLLIALVPVLTSDPLSRALLPLTGLALVINAAELGWAMQGMQSLRPLALYRVLGQIAYLAVLLAVLTGGATGTERYALCNALGFGVTAILTIIYVWRRLGARIVETLAMPRRLFGHFATRVRSSLASSISLTMIMIYYTMDFVLLGYLRDDYAVGEYTAASRLPLAVTALASLWVTVFYPHAARLFYADRDRLRRQVGRFATLSLLVGLPLVPLGFVDEHMARAGRRLRFCSRLQPLRYSTPISGRSSWLRVMTGPSC
jgi:O-antigen/teichoic acid export membrane protein